MRLVDNPFYILCVEPTDDVGIIQRAYDRKSLVEDEARCRRAKDILLHPQRRIEAEVTWLFSVPTADVIDRCQHLQNHPGVLSETAVTSFFHLTDTNRTVASLAQIAWSYHLLATRDEWSPDTLAEVGCQPGNCFLDVKCDELIVSLNRLREVAGISLIRRDAETADALQAYQIEIATCLHNRIQAFLPKEQRRIVTEIVADVTNHGQRYANEMVYRVVEQYERDAQIYIAGAAMVLVVHAWEIEKKLAETPLDDNTMESLLQQIQAWGKWTLPLRLAAQSKGQRYTENDIVKRIRHISVKTATDYGRPEWALRLTEALLAHGALSAQWQAVLQADKVRFEDGIIATRATSAGKQEVRHKTNGDKAAQPAGNDTTDANGMCRSPFAVTKTEQVPHYEGNHANPAHITEPTAAQDNRYRSESKAASADTNHAAHKERQRTRIVSGYKRDNKVKKLVLLVLGIGILAMASCDGDNGEYIENEDSSRSVEWGERYKSGVEDGWIDGDEDEYEDEYEEGYEDAYEGRYEDEYEGRYEDEYEGRYEDEYEGRYEGEYEEGDEEGDWQGYEDVTAGYAAWY